MFWKDYDLELQVSNYYNGRTYLGLYEPSSGEPFAAISENHPDINDEVIYGSLKGHEAIVIDNDFQSCFNSLRDCMIWIRENVKMCVITGEIENYPVLFIKKS